MPFDSSLNSSYLTSRFAEDPLPGIVRSGKSRGKTDGFDEELTTPPINLKFPFPTEGLQAFIMQILGAPGNVQILDESSGGGGSSTGGTGVIVGSSGRAGQGPQFQSYLQGANPGIFGEMPLGFPYAASSSDPVPTHVTLWPPNPSSIFLSNSTAPQGGPPGLLATSAWATPTQLALIVAELTTEVAARAPIEGSEDIEITDAASGLILRADDGHRVRARIESDGGGGYQWAFDDLGT